MEWGRCPERFKEHHLVDRWIMWITDQIMAMVLRR